MTSARPTALQLRSPVDILAIVPYLLGFHPDNDLVVVSFTRAQLTMTARIDLPAPDAPPDEARTAVDPLAAIISRTATEAVVITYGPRTPATATLDATTAALAARGVTTYQALRVTDNRWYSHQCDDPDCCPADGPPYDPAHSHVPAEAVLAGRPALPDRAAVAAQIEPITGPAREAMRQATQHAARRLTNLLRSSGLPRARENPALLRLGEQAIAAAFDRYRRGGRLTDDEAALLTVLLTHTPIRDHAWQRTHGEDWHLQLWADLTRRAEPDLAAAPAALLAFAAWRSGDGALANIAVDRAMQAQPDYRMAQLLTAALTAGIPPAALHDWPLRPD
jgi:hypothetical protein